MGQDYPITTIGHGDLVETQNGEWWSVMLGVRPLERNNMLGRETFLTPVTWEKDWPVFNAGVGKVLETDKRPNLPWTPVEAPIVRDDFNDEELNLVWNFLRTPKSKWYALEDGKLKINLRNQQLTEEVNPSLIARRINKFEYTATTALTFKTKKDNEVAGMAIVQNDRFHYQFIKTAKTIQLIKVEGGEKKLVAEKAFNVSKIVLKVNAKGLTYDFYYGETENNMQLLAENADATISSTTKAGGFIGPFIGMYASSKGKESKAVAIYDWFEYR